MKLKDMIVNNDKIKLPHCMAPWCMSYINADNSMRACCLLDLNSYIADNRFTEIWNSQIYRELRSAMYYHSSLPEKCVNCQDSFRYSWIKEAITYILMPLEIDFNKIEYPRNFNIERLYEIYELHGFLRVHSRFIEIELESKWKRNKIYSTFFGQLFYIKVQKVSIIRILGVMEHMFSIYVSIFLG